MFEIAAWLPDFLSEGSALGNYYIYIFEISNLLNLLRGVIIFILFIVLQPNVRSYLLTQIFNKEIPDKNSSNQPVSSIQRDFVTYGSVSCENVADQSETSK